MAIPTKLPAGVKTWNPTKLKAFIDTYGEPDNVGSGIQIDTANLADEAVTADKIEDGAVGAAKLDADLTEEHAIVDGLAHDKVVLTVVSDGGLQLDITALDAGDVKFHLNGADSILDCTTGDGVAGAARVELAAGADANNPVVNYVYVTDTAGVASLAVSTTKPSGVFAWVGKVVVPDAVTWATTGEYLIQRYTEAYVNDGRGALSHQREKLRALGATYESGGTHTLNITGAGTVVHLDVAAAVVYQLHKQNFPATATGPYYYGNGTTPYTAIDDLSLAALYSGGGAVGINKRYNLVIWGAVNYSAGDCKLFVNLPTDGYNSDSQAIADALATADFSIPAAMRGTAFMIARVVLKYTGSIWEEIGTYSLLGTAPGAATGGAGAVLATEFGDATFRVNDSTDATKQIAFEASTIATGTTRTITMPDADVDLGALGGGAWTENQDVGGYSLVSVSDGDIDITANGSGELTVTETPLVLNSASSHLKFYDTNGSDPLDYIQVEFNSGNFLILHRDASSSDNTSVMQLAFNGQDHHRTEGHWELQGWDGGIGSWAQRFITGLGDSGTNDGVLSIGPVGNNYHLNIDGKLIQSQKNGAAEPLGLNPFGGDVALGNFDFNADQTVGAGQDNFVLTYDNASGKINLEAAGGGGGSQTPWTSNIDTAGYSLTTAAGAGATADIVIIPGASSGDYAGDVNITGAVGYYEGSSVNITAGAAGSYAGSGYYGGHVNITAGASGGYQYGGRVNIIGGIGSSSLGYEGGDVRIDGGNGSTGGGKGGSVLIEAGGAAGGDGGSTTVKGGEGTTHGDPGRLVCSGTTGITGANVTLVAGAGRADGANNGGDVYVTGGGAGLAGTSGKVIIKSGTNTHATGVGGDVVITTEHGGATSGNAGNVLITAGTAAGSGSDGFVSIQGQIFPAAAGTAGWVLKTDGTNCYWAAA